VTFVLPLFEGRTTYFDNPERSLEGMLTLIYAPWVAGQGNPGPVEVA
jgi:hypothetical protein